MKNYTMPPAFLCECGATIAYAQGAKHRDGQDHKFKMAEKRAHARGHYFFVPDAFAFAMMKLGLTKHFTQVRTELNKNGHLPHYKTSREMADACTRFASRTDDRPESTLHAALVFASVYGDETPKILIGMIDAEIESAKITEHGRGLVATRESDLVALLRANGVQSPALTLTNLMPHLLAIALAELPGVAQ